MRAFTAALAAALAAGLALSPIAQAAQDTLPQTTVSVLGPAHHSCADWTRSQADPALKGMNTAIRFWAIGFVSGLAASEEGDILRDTAPEDVWHWLDGFCSVNPGSPISSALFGPFRNGLLSKPNT